MGESREEKVGYYMTAVYCVLEPFAEVVSDKHMARLLSMREDDISALLEMQQHATDAEKIKDISINLNAKKGELILAIVSDVEIYELLYMHDMLDTESVEKMKDGDYKYNVRITHTSIVDNFVMYFLERELDFLVKDNVTGKSYLTLCPIFHGKEFPLCLRLDSGIKNHKMRLYTLCATNADDIDILDFGNGNLTYVSNNGLEETRLDNDVDVYKVIMRFLQGINA